MHGNNHGANALTADPEVYRAPNTAAMAPLDESRVNIPKFPFTVIDSSLLITSHHPRDRCIVCGQE